MKICADDFGLTENINAAIISLAEMGHIQQCSVMVNGTYSDNDIVRLKNSGIEIGLHYEFNFLRSNYSLRSQYERFIKLFDQMPTHIDSHLHLHCYPILQERFLQDFINLDAKNVKVRSVKIHPKLLGSASNFKLLYLKFLDYYGQQMQKKLIKNQISTNEFLWGVFANHLEIKDVFSLLKESGTEGDLFFMHPGMIDEKGIKRMGEFNFIKAQMKNKGLTC